MFNPVNCRLDLLFASALYAAKFNARVSFEYTDVNVPETGKAIYAMWVEALAGTSSFRVFNGANDADKLYFSPNTNLLYRAVHDLDHALAYSVGRGTTKYEDEKYLNCLMAKRAYDYAVCNANQYEALELFFAVYHDTVGQVEYYKNQKDFCVDQRSNTVKLMNECLGVRAVRRGDLSTARQVMLGYMYECNV